MPTVRSGEQLANDVLVEVYQMPLLTDPLHQSLLAQNPSMLMAALQHVTLPRALAEVKLAQNEDLEAANALQGQWGEAAGNIPKSSTYILDAAASNEMTPAELDNSTEALVSNIRYHLLNQYLDTRSAQADGIKNALNDLKDEVTKAFNNYKKNPNAPDAHRVFENALKESEQAFLKELNFESVSSLVILDQIRNARSLQQTLAGAVAGYSGAQDKSQRDKFQEDFTRLTVQIGSWNEKNGFTQDERDISDFLKTAAENQVATCKSAVCQMQYKDSQERKEKALRDLESATAETARQATNSMIELLNEKYNAARQAIIKEAGEKSTDKNDPRLAQTRFQQEVLARYYEPKSPKLKLGFGSSPAVSIDVFNQKNIRFSNGITREAGPDPRSRLFRIKLSRSSGAAELQLQELAMIMRAEGITLHDNIRAFGKDGEKVLGFLAAEGLYKPAFETSEMQKGIKMSVHRAERDLRSGLGVSPKDVDVSPVIPSRKL